MYYEGREDKRTRVPTELEVLQTYSGLLPRLDQSWTDRPWSDRLEREMEGRWEPWMGRTVLRWIVVALLLGFVGLVSATSRPPNPDTPAYID